MQVVPTSIPGLKMIIPDVFNDGRGYFFESFNKLKLQNHGIDFEIWQSNESCSAKNVLRGLHFQKPPYGQAKLVRVIRGSVLDVAVDIRRSSPFYGKWISEVLSEQNKKMILIPEGFAHGFLTLEDNTVFSYECNMNYHKEAEEAILWNDPDLGIMWNVSDPVVSEKDKNALAFRNFISPFN